MTDDEFREANASLTSPSRLTVPHERTYWLTRDMYNGVLSQTVEVWYERPDRMAVDGDVTWIAPLRLGDRSVLYARWTVTHALAYVGPGIPEDARQCTRVGEEPKPDTSS